MKFFKGVLAALAAVIITAAPAQAETLRNTMFPNSVGSTGEVIYMADDTGEYRISYVDNADDIDKLNIESAGEAEVDLTKCRYQLSLSINGQRGGIDTRHREFLNVQFFDALIDDSGYMKRVLICEEGLRVSKETYKIDMEEFLKTVNSRSDEVFGGALGKDYYKLSDGKQYSFIPNYIERFNPKIIETTSLTFSQRSGAYALDLEMEEIRDYTDFEIIEYVPVRGEKSENGMYPLSNGEYIADYDYRTTDAKNIPYWYYQHPIAFYNADGSVSRSFGGIVPTDAMRVLYSAALDDAAYWKEVTGMSSRMDYTHRFKVWYSDDDFSDVYTLTRDEWGITEIPQILPNGVREFCRSEGEAHNWAGSSYKRTYWLGYGGDYRMVKQEIPKLYVGQAGEYKVFRNEINPEVHYFTKDDVHFITCKYPDGGLSVTSGANLVKDNESGGEYFLINEAANWYHRVKKSAVDAAWNEYAAGSPTVILNRNVLAFEENPYIDDGTTMIPVRFLFEEMGACVTWNDTDKTAQITLGDKNIQLTYGSANVYINGGKREITKPVNIKSGRTFVPLRFISEALGYDVLWDDGVIYIDDGKPHKGEKIGEARYNAFSAYLGGQPIESVTINGYTYVPLHLLGEYGFAVTNDIEYKITEISKADKAPEEHEKPEKTGVRDACRAYTDVYIDGEKTDAYYVTGDGTYIMLDALARYGEFGFDGERVSVDY